MIHRPSVAPKTVAIYSCGEVIGDGLYKLAFVEECRRRFPQARITWIAGLGPTTYAGVLKPFVANWLDEVIENPGIGRLSQLLDPRPPLGGRRFDLVIDTQRNVLRTLCVRRIRHGVFVAGTADFWLSDVRPGGSTAFPRSLIPRLRFLLDLVSETGTIPPSPIHISPEYRDLAATLLPDGPVYVGIAPGAADISKIWPLDRFLAVASAQAKAGRVPVFLLGPNEADWLARIKAAVPAAIFPEWDRTAGRPDLHGPLLVMALGARLGAAVANDSGVGHMLALSGVPLVSLFSQHDPLKYAPHAARLAIVDSKDYGGTDPSLIPVEPVIAALEGLLGEPGGAVSAAKVT
ncbi:MAG: glycosyltransferase family 9 protein [Alphaproteobacteria bacterium]|nr:glycosyltransferase family 9 protein [Alphaproteobacteria bacterium]